MGNHAIPQGSHILQEQHQAAILRGSGDTKTEVEVWALISDPISMLPLSATVQAGLDGDRKR